jgi:hypothetical protein
LPGASENHSSWNLAAARKVFQQYGGSIGTASDATNVVKEATPSKPEREQDMPIVMALLPLITQLFQPLVQQKVSQIQGVDPATAQKFAQGLVDKIGQLTGINTSTDAGAAQAVGALNAMPPEQQKPIVAQLEQHVELDFDKMKPMIDALGDLDAKRWQAEVDGRNAASLRSQMERWDMTKPIVYMAGITVTLSVLAMVGAILYQAIWKDSMSEALIALAGPLIAIAFGVWREVFAYRFDGSKESAAQNAVMQEIARKNNVG